MNAKKISAALAVAVFSLGSIARVSAQQFVLGGTGFVADQLILGTTSGTITLDTSMGEINSDHGFNQGWWSGTEGNSLQNDNVFTGSDGSDLLNDFNAFDLSSLAGAKVTSATLVLFEGGDSGAGPFNLSFWDVSTPLATLVNTAGTSTAIYNDLGSGVQYGSLAYAGGAASIDVTLNAAALASINGGGTGGYFAVGGTLTQSGSAPDAGTTLGLLGMSASCLFGLRRKK